MWSCWIKPPYQSKHNCVVTWEFIISKVASLISNAPSCFITREKVFFGDTSGLIIFLMFNLLPKHLSGWMCQWVCFIESELTTDHNKDSLVASGIFKQGLSADADLQNESPFLLFPNMRFWTSETQIKQQTPIQKPTVHNFIRKFCALTGSILTLRKEIQKTSSSFEKRKTRLILEVKVSVDITRPRRGEILQTWNIFLAVCCCCLWKKNYSFVLHCEFLLDDTAD